MTTLSPLVHKPLIDALHHVQTLALLPRGDDVAGGGNTALMEGGHDPLAVVAEDVFVRYDIDRVAQSMRSRREARPLRSFRSYKDRVSAAIGGHHSYRAGSRGGSAAGMGAVVACIRFQLRYGQRLQTELAAQAAIGV